MLKQLKNPFNLVSLILTVISIVLSVIFYQKSIQKREIAYEVSKPINKIYDALNTTPKIKLVENDSVPITNNVYLLTSKIWNSGDLSITQADVRRDITIDIGKNERILDYKIINQKEDGIANFRLNKLDSNKLILKWDYFDPKYGITFQILYSGKSDEPNFSIAGKILGVNKFYNIQSENNKRSIFTLITLIIFYPLVVIFCFVRAYNRRKNSLSYIHWLILGFIIFLAAVYFLLKYYVFVTNVPL